MRCIIFMTWIQVNVVDWQKQFPVLKEIAKHSLLLPLYTMIFEKNSSKTQNYYNFCVHDKCFCLQTNHFLMDFLGLWLVWKVSAWLKFFESFVLFNNVSAVLQLKMWKKVQFLTFSCILQQNSTSCPIRYFNWVNP